MPNPERGSSLGVMQPYLFPYLGYFQLIAAVDKFVVYDDVNYIKQGWINRNRILVNGDAHLFTLPVKNASSFTTIREVGLDTVQVSAWRDKFLRTMAQTYNRAPNFKAVQELLDRVFAAPHGRLVDLLVAGIREVMAHIGLETELVPTSSGYANRNLSGQARILDICSQEEAGRYVNAIGGKELYDQSAFAQNGITLSFLRSGLPEYRQGRHPFVPGLSILDAMLFVPVDELRDMIQAYSLE
jgi:hypothetical protein